MSDDKVVRLGAKKAEKAQLKAEKAQLEAQKNFDKAEKERKKAEITVENIFSAS